MKREKIEFEIEMTDEEYKKEAKQGKYLSVLLDFIDADKKSMKLHCTSESKAATAYAQIRSCINKNGLRVTSWKKSTDVYVAKY